MLNIKTLFDVPSYEDWIEKLERDLTSEEFSKISSFDPLEEIHFRSHAHASLTKDAVTHPGIFPYTRGFDKPSNDWRNGKFISFTEEVEMNKKALEILMKGCDLLIFELPYKAINLTNLLSGIGLEYIEIQFEIHSLEQWKNVVSYFSEGIPSSVTLNIDLLVLKDEDFSEIAEYLKKTQYKSFVINGHHILEAGGSSFQELAFCLSAAHHALFKLMEAGLNVDEAAACIHFSMGIGSNYFMEIAKFRAIRILWSNLIAAYAPEHDCSYFCSVTAHTISLNKSLKDPYTNLLRQTTEAMSAVSGGVQCLVIHPYDSKSTQGSSALAERMSLNISLLLKEESHFDAVNDPLGGSYSVELLTEELSMNAWEFFKQLESLGGICNIDAQVVLSEKVEEKSQLRIQQFLTGEKILIGVTKFLDSGSIEVNFKPRESYLGMKSLIIERDIILQA
jgi:methylmalonyl-CoA mutase